MNFDQITLADDIYYLGVVDWAQRDFHGYHTPRGVTYNSYVIKDEKIAIIDAVKHTFGEEHLARLKELVDLSTIDYVIVNHVEPDHSSSLPLLMAHAPQAKVVCTTQGKAEILKYYETEFDFLIVKEGDSISLGNRTLKFVPLPMVHWPDSMATYLVEDEILFSNDAFGQHYSSSKLFDDENFLPDVIDEARKYYANILMPLGKVTARALPKIEGLSIKMIAPSHGLVWRSHVAEILECYEKWVTLKSEDKVVIIYDSMWGTTEKMARTILEGIASTGVKGVLLKVSATSSSDIAKEVLEAKGVLIGSPTQHNGVLATIGGILYYLRGLQPAGKVAAAFGAYGWAGGANPMIEEALNASGMEVKPGINVKWRANADEIQQCFQFGKAFGEQVLARN